LIDDCTLTVNGSAITFGISNTGPGGMLSITGLEQSKVLSGPNRPAAVISVFGSLQPDGNETIGYGVRAPRDVPPFAGTHFA